MALEHQQKLLAKYPSATHKNIIKNDKAYYSIKHAYFVGTAFVYINIKVKYNPYNSWDKHDAMVKAKKKYREIFFNVKS